MREADFNQFIRLRNQLVVAVRVKLLAKDMEEQLKLTHKVVEVVDRPHRKICVTMLRYNVEKPETSYVRVRLFGRRKDEEKFNQIVYVNYQLDEFLQTMYFSYVFAEIKRFFSEIFAERLRIGCSIMAANLPSAEAPFYRVVILTNESEKSNF